LTLSIWTTNRLSWGSRELSWSIEWSIFINP
jgi:hypothetical protein